MKMRDTAPAGVRAVEDYTFDQLITHMHDYHAMGAEAQAEDEVSNGTEVVVLNDVRAMTREQAIDRLPGHYFQSWDGPDSIEAARMQHAHEHADSEHGGGYGAVHFHPGQWREGT